MRPLLTLSVHFWHNIMCYFPQQCTIVIVLPLCMLSLPPSTVINIGFEPVVYNFEEDVGFADLTFVKFNNPDSLMEDITVVFSTADGSAVGQFTKSNRL